MSSKWIMPRTGYGLSGRKAKDARVGCRVLHVGSLPQRTRHPALDTRHGFYRLRFFFFPCCCGRGAAGGSEADGADGAALAAPDATAGAAAGTTASLRPPWKSFQMTTIAAAT